MIVGKLVEAFKERIEWIRKEQSLMQEGKKIEEKQINTYIYNCANHSIALMTELVVNCEDLMEEPLDPRFPLEAQMQAPVSSPLAPIFLELWPILNQVLHDFTQLERLMESVTRLVQKLFKVVARTCTPYVQNFLQFLVSNFEVYPYSAFVFSFEICLKLYGEHTHLSQPFLDGYETITAKCVRILDTFE